MICSWNLELYLPLYLPSQVIAGTARKGMPGVQYEHFGGH